MNLKKIALYLLFSYGLSWGLAGLVGWTNLSEGEGFGGILMKYAYMWGPAIAVLLIQGLVYRQSLRPYGWQFERIRWRWMLLNALLPIAVLIATLFFVFLLGNIGKVEGFGYLDLTREGMADRSEQMIIEAGQNPDELGASFTELKLPVGLLLFLMIFGGLIGGVTINLIAAFGEELGWRGLLLVETRALGYVKSSLIVGTVWGLWHAPLVYLGLNYPGYPWEGIGMMVLLCIALSFLMNFLAIRAGTIAAPSGFHGIFNGLAGISLVLVHDANPLLGSSAGLA
ncbi:MAG: CPBP family intramembrane glutamic endopeptidase, partial [Bacteroidota bacterium]